LPPFCFCLLAVDAFVRAAFSVVDLLAAEALFASPFFDT